LQQAKPVAFHTKQIIQQVLIDFNTSIQTHKQVWLEKTWAHDQCTNTAEDGNFIWHLAMFSVA